MRGKDEQTCGPVLEERLGFSVLFPEPHPSWGPQAPIHVHIIVCIQTCNGHMHVQSKHALTAASRLHSCCALRAVKRAQNSMKSMLLLPSASPCVWMEGGKVCGLPVALLREGEGSGRDGSVGVRGPGFPGWSSGRGSGMDGSCARCAQPQQTLVAEQVRPATAASTAGAAPSASRTQQKPPNPPTTCWKVARTASGMKGRRSSCRTSLTSWNSSVPEPLRSRAVGGWRGALVVQFPWGMAD